MEYSLKSCPFCGSEGVGLVHLWDKFGNIEGGRICCSGCGGTYADATASCDEDLIQSWNTRPGDYTDWVPVDVSLPAENVRVLVTCQTKKGVKSINLAYYLNGFWHGQGSMSGVTAWRPLPAEYDEEVDAE